MGQKIKISTIQRKPEEKVEWSAPDGKAPAERVGDWV